MSRIISRARGFSVLRPCRELPLSPPKRTGYHDWEICSADQPPRGLSSPNLPRHHLERLLFILSHQRNQDNLHFPPSNPASQACHHPPQPIPTKLNQPYSTTPRAHRALPPFNSNKLHCNKSSSKKAAYVIVVNLGIVSSCNNLFLFLLPSNSNSVLII